MNEVQNQMKSGSLMFLFFAVLTGLSTAATALMPLVLSA